MFPRKDVVDECFATNVSLRTVVLLCRVNVHAGKELWISSSTEKLPSSLSKEAFHYSPRSCLTSANFSTANSMSSLLCAAEICVRIRAFP